MGKVPPRAICAPMRGIVEATLNLFPEVTWDRWSGDTDDPMGIVVFGWLPREDGRADFVLLRINVVGPWMFATSSVKHSAEFAQRLGFHNHGDCKRVEHTFKGVQNVAKHNP